MHHYVHQLISSCVCLLFGDEQLVFRGSLGLQSCSLQWKTKLWEQWKWRKTVKLCFRQLNNELKLTVTLNGKGVLQIWGDKNKTSRNPKIAPNQTTQGSVKVNLHYNQICFEQMLTSVCSVCSANILRLSNLFTRWCDQKKRLNGALVLWYKAVDSQEVRVM